MKMSTNKIIRIRYAGEETDFDSPQRFKPIKQDKWTLKYNEKKKATAIELQESNKIIQVEEERTWKLCQQNNKRVTFTKQKRIATPPPKNR